MFYMFDIFSILKKCMEYDDKSVENVKESDKNVESDESNENVESVESDESDESDESNENVESVESVESDENVDSDESNENVVNNDVSDNVSDLINVQTTCEVSTITNFTENLIKQIKNEIILINITLIEIALIITIFKIFFYLFS